MEYLYQASAITMSQSDDDATRSQEASEEVRPSSLFPQGVTRMYVLPMLFSLIALASCLAASFIGTYRNMKKRRARMPPMMPLRG